MNQGPTHKQHDKYWHYLLKCGGQREKQIKNRGMESSLRHTMSEVSNIPLYGNVHWTDGRAWITVIQSHWKCKSVVHKDTRDY